MRYGFRFYIEYIYDTPYSANKQAYDINIARLKLFSGAHFDNG